MNESDLCRSTDPDLSALFGSASDEDLIPLRDYILNAVTNELDGTPSYRASPHQPSRYVPELVYEVKTFGGNTLVNWVRGDGVAYREVVEDVAKRMKVKPEEGEDVAELEFSLVMSVLDRAKEEMDETQLAELQQIVDEAAGRHVKIAGKGALAQLVAQGAIRVGGFGSFQLAAIVANAVSRVVLGRGLSFAANATLSRSVALFAGPVGWALSGLWLLVDIAGPAYRVTIPAVLHIAQLRLKQSAQH